MSRPNDPSLSRDEVLSLCSRRPPWRLGGRSKTVTSTIPITSECGRMCQDAPVEGYVMSRTPLRQTLW